jgi:predicted nucleic acid-binding protein
MKNKLIDIIADSSAVVSLLSTNDSNFSKAMNIQKELSKSAGKILVPAEVYAEILNVLGKKGSHKAAAEKVNNFLDSSSVLLVESSTKIREVAIKLFMRLPASVSYTDCLVMASADHFETKIIFGFDEIFSKNGYKLPGKD